MASADFSCAICFDTATEPVVTRCGHLFCWGCLDHWLTRPNAVLECPVCKGRTDPSQAGDVIPLYGKGKRQEEDARPKAPAEVPAAEASAGDSTSGPYHSAGTTHEHSETTDTGAATAASSSAAAATGEAQHHARPHAPRAPTPPRPRPNRTRRYTFFATTDQGNAGLAQNTRWHFSSIGFPIMFFGLDSVITPLFIIAAILYCAYRFLPWREWKDAVVQRWQQRAHPQAGQQPEAAADSASANSQGASGAQGAVQPPPPPPSASTVAQIQWEYCGVLMLVLGLVLLVVY